MLFPKITKIIPGPLHLPYKPMGTNMPACQVEELVIVVEGKAPGLLV